MSRQLIVAALPGVTFKHPHGRRAIRSHARYLARVQQDKNELGWTRRAEKRRTARREIWLDFGRGTWAGGLAGLFWACTNGIEKTRRTGSYLDDGHCWGFRLFDLAAIGAWHLNVMDDVP